MKAFVVKEPFNYCLEDIPVPVCTYDGVVVRVLAAALCHSDLDILEGRRRHQVRFPNVCGHEFTGTVVEKGSGIKHVNLGDHVVCECIIWCGICRNCRRGYTSLCDNFNELGTMENGGFAEYVALPGRLTHRAEGLTVEEAALMEPAGNGFHAVEKAGILPGDNVLILGPGPIGLFAMQFASLYNPARLIVAGTRDARLSFAKRLGATHTVNVKTTDAVREILDITHGAGADRIINCATSDSSFMLSMAAAGKNSVIVMEGLSGSGKPLPVLMDDFIVRTVSVIPATGVHTRQYMSTMDMVRAKKINVEALITHRFPLDQMNEALHTMKEKRDEAMKILIYPNGINKK